MNVIETTTRVGGLPEWLLERVVAVPEATRRVQTDLQTAAAEVLGLPRRLLAVVDGIDIVLEQVEDLTRRTDDAVRAPQAAAGSATAVSAGAAVAVEHASTQIGRCQHLLDMYESALTSLAPVVSAAADDLRSQHLRAVVQLLDLVPDLVGPGAARAAKPR